MLALDPGSSHIENHGGAYRLKQPLKPGFQMERFRRGRD